MANQIDQEILRDFLSEAGELLEELNEELVELENRPDDSDLLNKAFRAFHTIKGGAGFVGLDPLIEVCHRAEEVFSALRDGKIRISADLMDPLLKTLDVVNEQFDACREGRFPDPAPAVLLAQLTEVLTISRADEAPAASTVNTSAAAEKAVTSASDPADAEFELLLAAANAQAVAPVKPVPANTPEQTDTINDDEFEALLDELHGSGDAPGKSGETQKVTDPPDTSPPPTPAPRTGESGKPQETVRIDVTRLDAIMKLAGELVLVRNRLNTYSQEQRDTALIAIADTLDRVTVDVQTAVMDSRLQPVRKVFSRFPRLVRDLARDLNKQIELHMSGEDTELDKHILDALAEPLVHLVRNAADHGIEPPEERAKQGKPRSARLHLSAAYVGDRVEIAVREDGRGMDVAKLHRHAIEKGIVSADAAAGLSEREVLELIFKPGFSTSTAISNISGRGVGMDAVRTKVAELNGRIDIESKKGAGSCFTISVPLTLAILPTLMVTVSNQRFALVLSAVSEVCELDCDAIHYLDGQAVLIIRGSPLVIFRASEYLGLPQAKRSEARSEVVVVLELDNRRIGLIVDEILGQEEAVMKPLGVYVRGLPGMSGGAVTGEGNIALILDVADLLRRSRQVRSRRPVKIPEMAEV